MSSNHPGAPHDAVGEDNDAPERAAPEHAAEEGAAHQAGAGAAAPSPNGGQAAMADEDAEAEYWFSDEEEGEEEMDWLDAVDDEDFPDELDADDELGVWNEDWDDEEDGSEADSMESEDLAPGEQEAAQQLAAQTAGRHICPGYAAYGVHTASHHFQSADALAVAQLPPTPGTSGGLVAVTFDALGVVAWLLPPPGSVKNLGISQPGAVRLGGFQALRDIYSLALSPDGRFIATGGEGGLLTFYSLDPSAAPRPPLQSGLELQGVNYFYTPLALPNQSQVQALARQNLTFLVAPSQQDFGAKTCADHGPVPAAVAGGACAAAASVATEMYSATAQRVSDTAKGKQPTAFPGVTHQQDQHKQQQPGQQLGQQQAQSSPAAVMLRGVFALGLDPLQARQSPYDMEGMCNGVRFGLVAGRQRLLAADQSRYVYVFDLPEDGSSLSSSSGSSSGSSGGDLRPQQMLCANLGQKSPHWQMQPVNFFRTTQHAAGARVTWQLLASPTPPPPAALAPTDAAAVEARIVRAVAQAAAGAVLDGHLGQHIFNGERFRTAALGPFPVPCNLAAASPDGRWVAVVGDAPAVFLCDQQAGFAWRQLPFDLAGSRHLVEQGLDVGSQYAAWNSSSTLLAVTSDALHAVFVFEPGSGHVLMRVEGHPRPCLCVGFAAWDDRLLVYAEERHSVHLRRVPPATPSAAPASSSPEPAAQSGASGGGGSASGGGGCLQQNAQDDLADASSGTQLLHLPVMTAFRPPTDYYDAQPQSRRVTGMASTAQGELLVTTRQGALLRYFSSQRWRQEQHATWPPAFRAAIKAFLLTAHRQHQQATHSAGPAVGDGGGGGAVGLWSLPLALLQHIIELAAGSRTEWLPQQEDSRGGSGHGGPEGEAAAQV